MFRRYELTLEPNIQPDSVDYSFYINCFTFKNVQIANVAASMYTYDKFPLLTDPTDRKRGPASPDALDAKKTETAEGYLAEDDA